MAWAVRGAAGGGRGGGAGFVVHGHAELGQGADNWLQGGVLLSFEKLDALNAGELVGHRFRNLGLLEVNRQDALASLGGEGDFLDDILGAGGVVGDGEDEHLAATDGGDDFLAPHGGALDAHLVDPHRDSSGAEAIDEVEDSGAILRGVADEDFGNHRVRCSGGDYYLETV
ncbi:MAG: hypothetical protein QGG00_11910 [Verrucomicrobiota bacterium]|nr:hypothetical protein [Verrucomicrobiota bacterium]